MNKSKQNNHIFITNHKKTIIITTLIVLAVITLFSFLLINGNSVNSASVKDDTNQDNIINQATEEKEGIVNQLGLISGINLEELRVSVATNEDVESGEVEFTIANNNQCQAINTGWQKVVGEDIKLNQADVDAKRYLCVRRLSADGNYVYDQTHLDADQYQTIDESTIDVSDLPDSNVSEPGLGDEEYQDLRSDNNLKSEFNLTFGLSFERLEAVVEVKNSTQFQTLEYVIANNNQCQDINEGWQKIGSDDLAISFSQADVDAKRYLCVRGLLEDGNYEYVEDSLDADRYQNVDDSDIDVSDLPDSDVSEPGLGQ